MNRPVVWLGGLAVLFLFLLSVEKELRLAGSSMGQVLRESIAEEFCNSIYQSFVPSFAFMQEKRVEGIWFADRQITGIMPLYGYTLEQKKKQLRAEVQEGTSAETALEQGMTPTEMMSSEMTDEESNGSGGEKNGVGGGSVGESGTEESGAEDAASMEALLQAENEAAIQAREAERLAAADFVPHGLVAPVDLDELRSYETLVNKFYTIDSNTMAGSDQLNVDALLSHDMTLDKEGEGPQILIYHTHSQETFADSVPGDKGTTIVGVGERLCNILTEEYGYRVLHHTGEYDVDSRDDAYSASLPAIEQVLAENPSIEVVIDLHRDQMAEETRLVMDLDGRPTARFMFFNGLSRTRKTGDISYLYNENLEENLAFSFQMKLKAEEYYPGLTRKNYLKGYRYNMHLRPQTLLIELGAQNNTVEEVMNACDPLAHILDMVLTGENDT